MSTEENEALAHRFYMEIFQRGDFAVADEIVAPDFVIHAPGLPSDARRGPEGVKRFATLVRSTFPDDLKITYDDSIIASDKVVIRWRLSGTHKGDLLGVPPNGKHAEVTGIDIFRLAGGKLTELWQNWDQLGLLQQLSTVSPS